MAATPKQCNMLTSYYMKVYAEKHRRTSPVNRNTARWSWANMLEDMTVDEVKELIDYYMKTEGLHNHQLPWFFNHYEELAKNKEAQEADDEFRARLREATIRRTEAWRQARGGNAGSDSGRETD
jgi:hypothetical protein